MSKNEKGRDPAPPGDAATPHPQLPPYAQPPRAADGGTAAEVSRLSTAPTASLRLLNPRLARISLTS